MVYKAPSSILSPQVTLVNNVTMIAKRSKYLCAGMENQRGPMPMDRVRAVLGYRRYPPFSEGNGPLTRKGEGVKELQIVSTNIVWFRVVDYSRNVVLKLRKSM